MTIFFGKGTLTINGLAFDCDSFTLKPTFERTQSDLGPVTATEIRGLYKFNLTGWYLAPVRRARGPRGRRVALNWRKKL